MMTRASDVKRLGKQSRWQFRLRTAILVTLVIAIAFAVGRRLAWVRHNAREGVCYHQLHIVSLALHNYHSANGCLPPAHVIGPDGTRWHSWRSLIRPYIDPLDSIWNAYDFSEPWDGPNNRPLPQPMEESIFVCPCASERGTAFTSYAVLVGPDTLFPGSKTRSLSDVETYDPILLVEITNSDISSTEPRDVSINSLSQSQETNSLRLDKPHFGKLRYITMRGSLGVLPPGTSMDEIKRLARASAPQPAP